jgi:predicted ATPase
MITVLAGMNGAGKSTLIQSLLVLRQSWESGSMGQGRLQLNGRLVDLGTAGDVYCADPTSELIEIGLRSDTTSDAVSFLSQQANDPTEDRSTRDRSKSYFLELSGTQIPDDLRFSLFAEPFNYLHAERIGARKIFSILSDEERPLWIGKFGENAPYLVGSDRRNTVIENSSLVLESTDGKEYSTLHFQWRLWMARLFPGFDSESEIYSQADQIRLAMALQQLQTGQSLFVRPTNTGFGLSYVLGIVVAGLVAKPGAMLIVENPEAHLHPRAQSILGEFLARVSAGGTQVIVETHSEHVVNGIRRMIKQGIARDQDARILFFSKEQGALEPTVTAIATSVAGEIAQWPDGFFDQLDKDVSFLLS